MARLSPWKMVGALFMLCTVMAIASPAQTFNTLAIFNGSNGSLPSGSLAQGVDGHLYGTTYEGGTGTFNDFGDGTIFEVAPGGKLTPRYNFCSGENCVDGGEPLAGIILATDGNFYGTARYEGAYGGGTVFQITRGGNLTTLYSFCAQTNCTDGSDPSAALVQATDGNFYGTTFSGGLNALCGEPPSGCGTAFKITAEGKLTTLHNFGSSGSDGAYPLGTLIQATDGNFYGTTSAGGTYGGGTVFKLTAEGELSTLYSFCTQLGCTDGAAPYGGLVQATDGNFYGTTTTGGDIPCDPPTGCGTVFKLTGAGTLVTLHSFGSVVGDGMFPYGGLNQATDGNLYGTTYQGGTHDDGTIFEITAGGTLTTLHNFCSRGFQYCNDGQWLVAGLVQATNGTLYGTAEVGGRLNDGVVFSLDMGLGPFVTFVRPAGKIGQTGGILGQGLIGTTSVSLNGIPASFTVVSDTFLKATVPAGAITGYVTVTTPIGILTSNVPFHVIP